MTVADAGRFTTVLFDLDGTLADTAPDLAAALNHVRGRHGQAALPFDHIRPVVSHGAAGLLRLGFGLQPGDAGYAGLRDELLAWYRENLAAETRLFPGMAALLDTLDARAVRWGVVTNKPESLTLPLLEALNIRHRAASVVGGDTLPQRKPDPAPLALACRQTGSRAEQCLYVGDAERDIEAGRRAGMTTLVALFGYLAEDDAPERWGADGFIEHPGAILDWLGWGAEA